jgi:rRNA processing protein Krr1/Pno1
MAGRSNNADPFGPWAPVEGAASAAPATSTDAASSNDDNRGFRPAPGSTSANIEVPKALHSRLIGKGGATIKDLQQRSGARINIPRPEEATNSIRLEGTPEAIRKVRGDIEQLLNLKLAEAGAKNTDEFLEVPKNKHSLIIGKGGSNLRELQEKFQVYVQVPGQNDPSTTVTLHGSTEGIAQAKAQIERLIGGKLSAASPAAAATATAASNAPRPAAPGKTLEELTARLAKIDITQANIAPECLFFPDTGAIYERFLAWLASPKQTLDVCVFTITDNRVSSIIAALARKGVKVRIISDDEKANDQGSDISTMKNAGIPVRVDQGCAAHMHNKFAILDGKVVLNGSYNWTTSAADENRENIVVTADPNIARAFIIEFEKLWTTFAPKS